MSLMEKFKNKRRIVVLITPDFRVLVGMRDCFDARMKLTRFPSATLHIAPPDLDIPPHLVDRRAFPEGGRCLLCERLRDGGDIYGVVDQSGVARARQAGNNDARAALLDVLPVVKAHRERLFAVATRNSPPIDLRRVVMSGTSMEDAHLAVLASAPIENDRFHAMVYGEEAR